jgi:YidC/Oxa1 family membrane protein insertase
LILAVLAVLVLFVWPTVVNRLFPPANPPVTQVVEGKSVPLPAPAGDPAAAPPAKLRDRRIAIAETKRVEINTPLLRGSINLKGAQIDDLSLLGYKETVASDSPPVTLFSPSGTAQSYYARYGWNGTNIALPNGDTVFTPDANLLAPGHPVTLSWTNPTGQRFDIRFTVDDKYLFTVDQSVTNVSGATVTVQPYSLLSRTGIPTDLDAATNHIGPIGVFGNGADYSISYKNLQGQGPGFLSFGSTAKAGENRFNDVTGGWIGFGDKYWLAALIPSQKATGVADFPAAQGETFNANFTLSPIAVASGKRVTTTSNLFAGAKEVRLLDGYEASLGVAHFGKAIDWGWFEIIEKPIFSYLSLLFRLIGNFGVAIICLTITIRALLFPIAQRQFASMANMRAIQPKMKALQERYKDDKPRQQQEIMKLYKEEKVNPLAGCLPLLLQIPIMFALYKVLLLATEMRHQPFALWIHDLSVPDPATILNLFNTLPFHPPGFLAIGVFPVLLGISMFFQMRLNPAPMDDMQKQIFAIMPWMLMFIMAPFAVGLQLYWITSNCITILQQQWLYSKHPALKVALPKKDAPPK